MENKVLGKKYNYKIDGDLFFSAHRDDLICKISKSKVAKDINNYLKIFLKKQSNSGLLLSMKYGLLPGGKKIRSKLLVDVGKIFNITST